MTKYTIAVYNKSGKTQSYMLFAANPIVAPALNPTVYTNIYMTAPNIPSPNGVTTFEIDSTPYALCGTSPIPVAEGVNVVTVESTPVILGNPTVPVLGSQIPVNVAENAPSFGNQFMQQVVQQGYTLNIGNFNYPSTNNISVGYGAKNKDGHIVPLATFEALPNNHYNVVPVVQYFVATGGFSPGTIIKVQDIGPAILVDFTTGSPNAEITQNSNQLYVRTK